MVHIIDSVRGFFTKSQAPDPQVVDPGGHQFDGSLHKSFVPENIYKPPFGFPRNQNVQLLRTLGKNAYIHGIISTLQFEASSTPWDIVVDKGQQENPEEIKRIKAFFNNPNGNSESFSYLIRAAVKDILELDSGVWVKVFDAQGKFKQIFARDGGSFVKNPDIHGYYGDRADIIPYYYYQFDPQTGQYVFINKFDTIQTVTQIANEAAYFQYGWSSAGVPIPFGKREIIWFDCNPQTTNVYGRSPLEVLNDVLYTLLYGAGYNLDFYLNNNIPEGVIQLIGATKDDIRAFRERWEAQFKEKDIFSNNRKKFFSFPITNADAKFTPFTFTSKDMEVIAQQQWFWKIVMACFGVTPTEMGFTEDSNKSTDANQSAIFKRKAITPLLDVIEYKINMQIMPELDPAGIYKFRFTYDDIEHDLKKHTLYQMQINMGIKSPEMIAEELGIDVSRLKADKKEKLEQQAQYTPTPFGEDLKTLARKEEVIPGISDYFSQSQEKVNTIIHDLVPKTENTLKRIS